ncbi:MAG: hypothetical protein K0U93_28500 [Gammaproteobacteria bacterium]|nr:hypothetical protein [Gammaproteobacteria bacterium]
MSGLSGVQIGVALAALAALVIVAVWWFRRRRPVVHPPDSVFAKVQEQQEVLWQDVPLTIVFDYEPYLKETARHRVNVHTVQRDAAGAFSLVGYCHDLRSDRVFLSHSIRGDVLVEKTGDACEFGAWLERLRAGEFSAPA